MALLLSPLLIFMLLMAVGITVDILEADEIIDPKLADFEIIDSEMNFSECCGGSHHIAIVGRIKNIGTTSGKAPHFEASFYNSTGQLIDSVSGKSYSLIIPPEGESTFRIRGAAQRAERDYESYKVTITAIGPDDGF